MSRVRRRTLASMLLSVVVSTSGCVLGYGRCKLLAPIPSSLTGRVHFRADIPQAGLTRGVPILILEKREYVYSPSTAGRCRPVSELQLIPTESLLLEQVIESAHVNVKGTITMAYQPEHVTAFVFGLSAVQLLKSRIPGSQDR